jgi:hypothetical protein
MWMILREGAWVATNDGGVIAMIQSGAINATTPIRHETWPTPQPLGAVAGFQHHLRMAIPMTQARAKKSSSLPLILGLVGAGVLILVFALVLIGKGGKSAEDSTPRRCNDVGDAFNICVEKTDRAAHLDNDTKTYLRVDLTITNSSHTPDDISDFIDLDFAVEATGGDKYGDDHEAEMMSPQSSCTMVVEQLQPHAVHECSLYFALPAGVTGDVLDVSHAGHQRRLTM